MRGINSITKRDKRSIAQAKADGRCSYCRKPLPMKEGTIDHFWPKALGGTNKQSNWRWCCLNCNAAKADMHPLEWLQKMPAPEPMPETRYEAKCRLLAKIATRAPKTHATPDCSSEA